MFLVSCISFFNYGFVYFLINIYSDLSQMALKYLRDTEANISNILIMTKDFNIRDNIQDPNFPYYSIHSDFLIEVTDSINLGLSKSTNQVPTRCSDNQQNSNLVIDIIFLRPDLSEFDNYSIYPDWRITLDHALLTVNIMIIEEHIQTRKHIMVKNSKEEENFIAKLIRAIKRLSIENIPSKEVLEQIVQTFANNIDRIQFRHSKVVNITKHSKTWWDKNCYRNLENYRLSKWIEDWKHFICHSTQHKIIKSTQIYQKRFQVNQQQNENHSQKKSSSVLLQNTITH